MAPQRTRLPDSRRTSSIRTRPSPTAFTLVELLVVVGIIALLMAMLFPALQKSRYEAQVTTCAARLQQLVAAVNIYAIENQGRLPRFDLNLDPTVAPNLWDVSADFYDTFRTRYKMPHASFFCPLAVDSQADTYWNEPWRFGFYHIGYAVWIPRRHGPYLIPPTPGDGQWVFYSEESEAYCGPSRQGEKIANRNPILTDVLLSDAYERVLPCADASRVNPADVSPYSQHLLAQRVHSFNAAYADGHVERLHPGAVRPRFLSLGNNWNWR